MDEGLRGAPTTARDTQNIRVLVSFDFEEGGESRLRGACILRDDKSLP